jgi:hypothetical protein
MHFKQTLAIFYRFSKRNHAYHNVRVLAPLISFWECTTEGDNIGKMTLLLNGTLIKLHKGKIFFLLYGNQKNKNYWLSKRVRF